MNGQTDEHTNQRRAEVSDWLDEFTMMGTGLNEGEKSLMRFAMKKEQERIIKLLKEHEAISYGSEDGDYAICVCQHWSLKAEPYVDHIEQLIKGEQK